MSVLLAPPAKWTERHLLDLLLVRFGRTYRNGAVEQPRYVCAEHVRDQPMFATGVADFIAADTWASGGYALHGFEIKVSRADWLVELRRPGKSETFRRWCTYWWLVTPDRGIVRGDLPPGWGHLTTTISGRMLRRVVDAPARPPVPTPDSFRAALLRATATTAVRRRV